jgi:hypothetical protein
VKVRPAVERRVGVQIYLQNHQTSGILCTLQQRSVTKPETCFSEFRNNHRHIRARNSGTHPYVARSSSPAAVRVAVFAQHGSWLTDVAIDLRRFESAQPAVTIPRGKPQSVLDRLYSVAVNPLELSGCVAHIVETRKD